MARKKTPGITRLANGRFRARSRRKGYPADSRVFDSLPDAAEWKADADAGKRHGTYVNSREAENTTLRDALKAYSGEVVGVKKGKTQVNERNHVNALIDDRISDYSLAALNIKHLREFKLRRLDTDNVRKPGCKILFTKNEPKMVHNVLMLPKLKAVFYAQPGTVPPSQPVRDWLKRLPRDERLEIGGDIQAVQFGWPLGMPLVRHLRGDLCEVRSTLPTRIARVIFAVQGNTMYLLHGFIKSTQKTPLPELELAEKRWKQIKP